MMKVALLIGEISKNAGQTLNLIHLVNYSKKQNKNLEFTVFAHNILDDNIFPDSVKVIKLKHYYSSLLSYPKLSKELMHYDLCYVKGSLNYVIPATRSRRPTIYVAHHVDPPYLFNKLKDKIKIKIGNILLPHYMRKAAVVATVSYELKEYFMKEYRIKAVLTPDIISEGFYRGESVKREIPKTLIRLLCVGNWDGFHGRKQQHHLLTILSESKNLDGINLETTFVGLRDEAIVTLKEHADRLGINTGVTFKGVLSEEDLIREYSLHHIYVTTTTFEGFYRQIIEAFAMGMPAVVYDSRKIVSDKSQCAAVNHALRSKAGLLFTDWKTLQNSISVILDNYSKFSQNAMKYASNFEFNKVGDINLNLIYRAMGRGS